MRTALVGIFVLLISSVAFGQIEPKKKIEEPKKVETVTILTSAVCGECKERIEKELNYTKGVVFAELDMDTKKVTVKYKTKFLNEDKVREVINNIGYDADDSKRNEEAFNELPKCCQSPGHCKR